jgi:uncharacterized protein YqkB
MGVKTKILIVAVFVVIFSFVLMNALNIDNGTNVPSGQSESGNTLVNFMGDYLRGGFTPAWISLGEGIDPFWGKTMENFYEYEWEIDGKQFYVSTEYNSNGEGIRINTIRVAESSNDFDADVATNFVDKYFKEYGNVTCAKNRMTDSLYCESYLMNDDNKVFIGAVNTDNSSSVIVFACEIPLGSDQYDWKSCNKWFKDLGV